MILFNVYVDSHNYRIPYKYENDKVYMFRCFKSDTHWITEFDSFKWDSNNRILDANFNDDIENEHCNNLTLLFSDKRLSPMLDKHYPALIKFLFNKELK